MYVSDLFKNNNKLNKLSYYLILKKYLFAYKLKLKISRN